MRNIKLHTSKLINLFMWHDSYLIAHILPQHKYIRPQDLRPVPSRRHVSCFAEKLAEAVECSAGSPKKMGPKRKKVSAFDMRLPEFATARLCHMASSHSLSGLNQDLLLPVSNQNFLFLIADSRCKHLLRGRNSEARRGLG